MLTTSCPARLHCLMGNEKIGFVVPSRTQIITLSIYPHDDKSYRLRERPQTTSHHRHRIVTCRYRLRSPRQAKMGQLNFRQKPRQGPLPILAHRCRNRMPLTYDDPKTSRHLSRARRRQRYPQTLPLGPQVTKRCTCKCTLLPVNGP
jgi:hypothetical protein